MTLIITNLVAQIKATANFLGLREGLASERYVRSIAHTKYHSILPARSLRRFETSNKISTYFRPFFFHFFLVSELLYELLLLEMLYELNVTCAVKTALDVDIQCSSQR